MVPLTLGRLVVAVMLLVTGVRGEWFGSPYIGDGSGSPITCLGSVKTVHGCG